MFDDTFMLSRYMLGSRARAAARSTAWRATAASPLAALRAMDEHSMHLAHATYQWVK